MLVDSSVWIDYFSGRSNPPSDFLHAQLGQRPVMIGDLMLTEVLQGFRHEHDFRTAARHLQRLDIVTIGGADIAMRAAGHFRLLRSRGVTVRKTIDTLIATWCLTHDVPLLHNDRDFQPFHEHLGLRGALDE